METKFNIDQKVVYPSQGVGVVKEIFEKQFKDTYMGSNRVFLTILLI